MSGEGTEASTMPDTPTAPKRGGIHPTYGKFIGGSALDDDYKMDKDDLYRFSSQVRIAKTIASIERSLRDSRDSTTSIKFNGTLEPTKGNATEIRKERFITCLKRRVEEHGQQTFYWEKIEVRFSHLDDFEKLPGSCLFIIALETCNASAFHDIEGAKKKLFAMELSSYPGENVTEFAGDAKRLIKIMQGAYSVPIQTGSQLISKLTGTSSELFNRKMWTLLDEVMTTEMEYELSDHKLFVKDERYAKHGPLGIIATMQAMHGVLLSQQRWPALANTLPQGNATPVTDGGGSGGAPAGGANRSALNGRRCFRCNGEHLVRDCPQPPPAGGGGTRNGGT